LRWNGDMLRIFRLAHVRVGEPVPTSPEHALAPLLPVPAPHVRDTKLEQATWRPRTARPRSPS
jgi:hypothetical protein